MNDQAKSIIRTLIVVGSHKGAEKRTDNLYTEKGADNLYTEKVSRVAFCKPNNHPNICYDCEEPNPTLL